MSLPKEKALEGLLNYIMVESALKQLETTD